MDWTISNEALMRGTLTDQPGGAIGKPKRQALERGEEPGTSETYHLRGSEVHSDLYYANGSVEALTGYGVINSTLYTKSGSTYKELPYKKYYVNGTVQTIYRRGNRYPDTLYVSGGDVTVRRQGDLMKVALYYGGTQRANLKLATFTTREVTALGG